MAGLGLNLKLVLYLQSQCLTESLGLLNLSILQAAKRSGHRTPIKILSDEINLMKICNPSLDDYRDQQAKQSDMTNKKR